MSAYTPALAATLEDPLMATLADYVSGDLSPSIQAMHTAAYCLMDALGCAILALDNPDCRRHLGPQIPGMQVPQGARVPGTAYVLDPVQAAYNIGSLIRWLDYNDTWLAAEWGHPSDNLGAILAVTDYLARRQRYNTMTPMTVRKLLVALTKAYEIQGGLAISNSFNALGLDHVILVRIASSAVTSWLLGGDRLAIIASISQAFLDGAALRTYRQEPNTGSRKSWAAGDATARGLRLALLTVAGEPGYPQVLNAPQYGFNEVIMRGKPLDISRPLGTYVVENILFKVAYPCEFHAQTAAEAAITLHGAVQDRFDAISRIVIATQQPALRIIDKQGPLRNPADRDHCLQYVVAICLLYGELEYSHFHEHNAADPRIDRLRAKMEVVEDYRYSRDYLNPAIRSVANRVIVHFDDGSHIEAAVEYPLGHPRRRDEALPLLVDKFKANLANHYAADEIEQFIELFNDQALLERQAVDDFMSLWVRETHASGVFPRSHAG